MNKKCIAWLLLVLLLMLGTAAGCKPAEPEKPEEHCAGGVDASGEEEAVICTDKAEYQYGEIVHVRFTYTNLRDRPEELNGGSEAAMDICERDVCWSDGQELTPELTRLVLAPGESRTIEWTWPPSQAHLDEWLGKSWLRWLNVSLNGILRYAPGYRPSAVEIEVKYYPDS